MDIMVNEPHIQLLCEDWYKPYVQQVSMLRLDVLHPVISGNKWYKLKYNIEYALNNGYKAVLTFGGAYSNHLIATAAAAKAYGLKSIGIVRGNYAELTHTLQDCISYGMELQFVSREDYNRKTDAVWLESIKHQYNAPFIIPEGGANEQGRVGGEDIVAYIPEDITHICVSVGTGTTFAGIRNALPLHKILYGYVPMKGGVYLKDEIPRWLKPEHNTNWQLFDHWHFGGFGKWDTELVNFMKEFYTINQIPLDIVYTGKMMFGIMEQLQSGFFPSNARVCCIHTGGLQGNSSIVHMLQY